MTIETASFPMINPGTNNEPDFYSGPSAINANETARVLKLISESPPNTTVTFDRWTMDPNDREELKRKIKGTAVFDDGLWNAMTAAQQRNLNRTVYQNILKFLLSGTP